MSKLKINESFEDINFLKSFTTERITSDLSLVEEELIADLLVHQVLYSTNQYELSHNYQLPNHLEKVRKEFEIAEKNKNIIKIPVIRQISPRTRKNIALIPTPTKYEEKQINDIEEWVSKIDTKSIYKSLSKQNSLLNNSNNEIINNIQKPLLNQKSKNLSIIPKDDIDIIVDNKSTNYYATITKLKYAEKEKNEKIQRLFNRYNNNDTDNNSSNKIEKHSRNVNNKSKILSK